MSTVYSDAAGNKYLGDCRWANHDILNPSINFLMASATATTRRDYVFWRDDMQLLLNAASYTSQTFSTSTDSFPADGTVFQGTFPSASAFFRCYSSGGGWPGQLNGSMNAAFNDSAWSNTASPWSYGTLAQAIDFHAVASSSMIGCSFWLNGSLPSFGWDRTVYGYSGYFIAAILQDVNTNYSYYSAGVNNKLIFISGQDGSKSVTSTSFSSPYAASHFIVSAKKSLLQTGRAAYSISCSDGQTPTSQWATDAWVYDNNATLGYPVIGRIPNVLLGIGSYTYLKPVKIQGSVFPDGGSPWYLPVGTFSGKVLLMRCYSGMT